MERADHVATPTAKPWRWSLLWLTVFACWTAYGLLYAYQEVAMYVEVGKPYVLGDVLRTRLVGMWGWIPLTVGLFWLVQRVPIRRGDALRAGSILMLAALAVVFVRSCFIYSLDPWIRWYETPPSFWGDVMPTSIQNNILLSWIMIGLAHAFLYFDRAHAEEWRASELQAQLAQARLDAIVAQLDPHFLFNALNSIAELVHHDAARADRMLVGLSALLRRSLESSRLQWVSLREELELLAQYLEIEKVRLGERMQVHWHVTDDCLDEAVPPLLLQPLVENAVVHAIARRTQPGNVRIGAGLIAGELCLEVEDDGAEGLPDVEGHGIGLANTRARLHALYGDNAALSLETIEGGGTRVGLRLPRLHGLTANLRADDIAHSVHFDRVPAP